MLCSGDFLKRLEQIAALSPKAIILREKDLCENEYRLLADKAVKICQRHNTPCILHNFSKTATELSAGKIHLPLPALKQLTEEDKKPFTEIGASCHSVEDAIEAEGLGCTYITAGHIFATDCKKGLPGRGLEFLKKVCQSVDIPVYAIGGIDKSNILSVIQAGAKGVCIMSGLMMCENPNEYLRALRGM